MSPIRRKLAVPLVAMDYLASALGKLADIVDAPPFYASFDVQDELMSSPGSVDTPSPAADEPDAKDRAIANLTMKLSDMQMALSALEGTSEPRVASEPDENLTAALAEANERLFSFSKDATEAHEAMLEAIDERKRSRRLSRRTRRSFPPSGARSSPIACSSSARPRRSDRAPQLAHSLIPLNSNRRSSNDALREDTLTALARMQAELPTAAARVRSEAERTVAPRG